jgi:hypothetical protein
VAHRAVRVLGVGRGFAVLVFIDLWLLYRLATGEDPTIEAFTEAMARNRSTVYRWRADFRKAFAPHSTPGELLDALGVSSPVTVKALGAMLLLGRLQAQEVR